VGAWERVWKWGFASPEGHWNRNRSCSLCSSAARSHAKAAYSDRRRRCPYCLGPIIHRREGCRRRDSAQSFGRAHKEFDRTTCRSGPTGRGRDERKNIRSGSPPQASSGAIRVFDGIAPRRNSSRISRRALYCEALRAKSASRPNSQNHS
jgi:hypothetical protein